MSELLVTPIEDRAPALEELRKHFLPRHHWNLAPQPVQAAIKSAEERGINVNLGRRGREWFLLFEHEGQYTMMGIPPSEGRPTGKKTWAELVAEGEQDGEDDTD